MLRPLSEKSPALMKIIADATDANAASGATAAPILAHPSANNCRAPPKIIPSDKCPVAKPINEQAIIGWWKLELVQNTFHTC